MGKVYSIPLNPDHLISGSTEKTGECTEWQAVYSYLELLLTTCPGEHKFDKNWGCKIWEKDFERITSTLKWENECSQIISDMIKIYESRLKETSVEVKVVEVSRVDSLMQTQTIKRKMDININAIYTSTGESCHFYYKLYLGPIGSE